MSKSFTRVELVAVVETMDNAEHTDWSSLSSVSSHKTLNLCSACSTANLRSRKYPNRTIFVLSWSMARGTQLEYAVSDGEAINYMPNLVREAPERWNAVLAPVIEQHLSTYLRSQIPVEAPQGFSADADADADTVDAIESPFVGEIK